MAFCALKNCFQMVMKVAEFSIHFFGLSAQPHTDSKKIWRGYLALSPASGLVPSGCQPLPMHPNNAGSCWVCLLTNWFVENTSLQKICFRCSKVEPKNMLLMFKQISPTVSDSRFGAMVKGTIEFGIPSTWLCAPQNWQN